MENDRGHTRPRASGGGMTVVVLNWNAGENDPFSVVNATIQQHFRACGKNVELVKSRRIVGQNGLSIWRAMAHEDSHTRGKD